MLIQQFDFSLAIYHQPQELDKKEIEKADAVIIKSYVEGGIYHSKKMLWWGNINQLQKPLDFIRSKKEQKTYQKNYQQIIKEGFQIKTIALTVDLYNKYKKLYEQTTLKQNRALNIDLDNLILAHIKFGTPCFIAGVFKKNTLIAGLTFRVNHNQVLVSSGAKTRIQSLRGGLGGLLEIELIQFCLNHHYQEIIHGKGINPAGIYSKSGLFEFKARYGFTAFPDQEWQTMFILNKKIAQSNLIFITIIDNQIGYLIICDDLKKELINKYQTKLIKKIEIKTFQEAIIESKNSIFKFIHS